MTTNTRAGIKKRSKISLIGSGQIGSTLAVLASMKQLGDVLLFDVVEGVPQGKALDLCHMGAIEGFSGRISGTNSTEDLHDSDVVIITAGVPRKPGMSRDDLLGINSKIITSVAQAIAQYCPEAFVICVTNPLDAMVQLLRDVSQLPHHQVVGMAGVLDSSRFNFFLGQKLNISPECIHSIILGSHGDTMVPLLRHTSVAGVSLDSFIKMGWITSQEIDDIVERTRNAGAEILQHLKTGSASLAPGSGAIEIAEAYLHDKKKLLCCAAYTSGKYGVNGLYIGVPVIIGRGGVERIVEVDLNVQEKKSFDCSVEAVKELHDAVVKLREKTTL